jgi:uncharacterized protein (TIGR02996 family)
VKTQEQAFRQAIRAGDESAHLVYADWLAEQGRPREEAVQRSLALSWQASACSAPRILHREPSSDGYTRVWFTDGRRSLFLWYTAPGYPDPYVLLDAGSCLDGFPRGGHVGRDRTRFSPGALQVLRDLGLGDDNR